MMLYNMSTEVRSAILSRTCFTKYLIKCIQCNATYLCIVSLNYTITIPPARASQEICVISILPYTEKVVRQGNTEEADLIEFSKLKVHTKVLWFRKHY